MPGETEKILTFSATQDTVDDDDEGVRLTLGPDLPDHVTAVTPSETTISIKDDDHPFVNASFDQPAYTAAEGASVTVTVNLSADPERTVVIPIAKTNNDDASSADYSGVPEDVTFNTGETSKNFTFSATDDTIDDDGESVTLSFGDIGDERVQDGAHPEATVNIQDNDASGITVSTATLEVDEQGTAPYTIVLDTQPTHNVTITLTVEEPAGTSGVTLSDNTLTFTDTNYNTAQTVTVSAAHDDNPDDETATITHSSSSDDSNYDDKPVADVAIVVRDDDETVTFVETGYTVAEGETIEVTVRLSEDPERTVTIPIMATPQGDASTGDYALTPAEVTFNAGDTEKTFDLQGPGRPGEGRRREGGADLRAVSPRRHRGRHRQHDGDHRREMRGRPLVRHHVSPGVDRVDAGQEEPRYRRGGHEGVCVQRRRVRRQGTASQAELGGDFGNGAALSHP